MENRATMNPSVICLLDDTDNGLMELESTVKVLAIGAAQANGDQTFENVLMHIANSLRDIRAQLDEAASAVMQLRKAE